MIMTVKSIENQVLVFYDQKKQMFHGQSVPLMLPECSMKNEIRGNRG